MLLECSIVAWSDLATKRTDKDQRTYESKLFDTLREPAKKLVKPMFKSEKKTPLRAPRRVTPKLKMTIEELHRGLTVLER